MHWRRVAISAAIVITGLIALGRITGFLVDWLWFSSIGYAGVFWTIFTAEAVLFIAVFTATAGAIWLSGRLTVRYTGKSVPAPSDAGYSRRMTPTLPEIPRQVSPRLPWRLIIAGIAILIGFLAAWGEISSWDMGLRFLLD